MIHPALISLIRLQSRGTIRRIFRGVKTLRGAIFSLIGVLWFFWMIAPQLFMAFSNNRVNPAWFQEYGPLILMVICVFTVLTGIGEKGFQFPPVEVNFLFAGPFSRRELLLYKILLNLRGIGFNALLFSLIFLTMAKWWIAAFLGFFLLFSFLYFLTVFFNLLRQITAEHLYNRFRILVGVMVVGIIVIALGRYLNLSLLVRIKESWWFGVLLAPFSVFIHTLTAQTVIPDLLHWGAYALLIVLGLAAAVVYLDADYFETTMNVGQKLYNMRLKQKRAGSLQLGTASKLRLRIPPFPWLGGAGPIIWRQLTHAVRISGFFLFYIFFMMLMMGIPVVLMSADKNPAYLPLVIFASIFLTVLSNFFPFDFRNELDHMDWLKRLPISSIAIACGEIVVPVFFISLLQILALGGAALWFSQGRSVLLILLVFCFPLNFLNFSFDNLIFLFFPARVMAANPGDFQAFGRNMVMLLLKFLLLLSGCGISAGMGFLVYWILGGYLQLGLLISWFVLILESVTLIPFIAWAFERLDITRDILA